MFAGLGCCNCGTSCGGLNYPYRGWKDSFWEGGFRGNGFLHSPLLAVKGTVYAPLLHVSDWYVTALVLESPQHADNETIAPNLSKRSPHNIMYRILLILLSAHAG